MRLAMRVLLPAEGVLLPVLLTTALLTVTAAADMDFTHHSNEQVTSYLRQLNETYPDLTHLYSIGQSVEGRELWVLMIGRNPRDHVPLRPDVKYVGNIHGNEVVGREILMHLIDLYVTSYGHNATITRFLNSTRVHVLVSINPDGYSYSEEGDCNGVKGRTNGHLVDLNRDFPPVLLDTGGYDVIDNGYNKHGLDLNRNYPDYHNHNHHEVQQETRAVMQWLKDFQFVLSAGLHGGTLVANYPYDTYPNARWPQYAMSKDDGEFKHLAKTYSFSHHTMSDIHPACANSQEYFPEGITNGANWYPVTGGMQDYNYIMGGCMEITLEVSCCKFPPASQLPAFWQRNKDALVNFLLEVHRGVKGTVRDDNDNPLEGAMVEVVGRDHPTNTTHQGEFWRILLPGEYTLRVTLVGYETAEVEVSVSASGPTSVDISLTPGGYPAYGRAAALPRPNAPLAALLTVTILLSAYCR